MDILFLVFIVQAVIFAVFGSFIANEKHRNSIVWFFLCFFFSFLAILALIAVPKVEHETLVDKTSAQAVCPFCKEEIKPDAIICKHCRSDLSKTKPITLAEPIIIESKPRLVVILEKAKTNPPSINCVTSTSVQVKRIDEKTGNVLFEVPFRKGVHFGVVTVDEVRNEAIIFAGGNFFFAPQNITTKNDS
jgi:hypothetical protein